MSGLIEIRAITREATDSTAVVIQRPGMNLKTHADEWITMFKFHFTIPANAEIVAVEINKALASEGRLA